MSLIDSILVQTEYTPDVRVDPNAPPSWLVKVLKPKITVTIAGQPVIMEPYGEPGQNKFWLLVAGVVFVLILLWMIKK